jgi:hypothetical protein
MLLSCGSEQGAADHSLHVQRSLSHSSSSPAQPRLGRRPPPTAALADEPPAATPPPRERAAPDPESTGPCPAPDPGPARTGRGRRPAGPHGPARPAPAGPARSPTRPRARHTSSPARPVVPSVWLTNACSGDRACRPSHRSASPTRTASRAASRRPPRRWRFRRNMAPNPSSARDWHDASEGQRVQATRPVMAQGPPPAAPSPPPGQCCTPKCIAVLG